MHISHCPEPRTVHKYCLQSTQHIFNFMLTYDKDILKMSGKTV